MSIGGTGGRVQSHILGIMQSFAPGVRGILKGGISLGKPVKGDWGEKLNEWAEAFVKKGMFTTSLSEMDPEQLEKIMQGMKKEKHDEGLDYVNLLAGIYYIEGQHITITNSKDEPKLKPLNELANSALLYQIAFPLIIICKNLNVISPPAKFVVHRDLASALHKILGNEKVMEIVESVYADYDEDWARAHGLVRGAILDMLAPEIPGIHGILHGGISIRTHLDEWGEDFLEHGKSYLNETFEQTIERGGEDALEERLKEMKKYRDKYEGEYGKSPEFINFVSALYFLQQKKYTTARDDVRVKTAGQLALAALFMDQGFPLLELGNVTRSISTVKQFRIGQVYGATIDDIFGISGISGIIEKVLG